MPISASDQQTVRSQLATRTLGFICILLLCGVLYAGLTPFHSPANQLTWVANANGLHFGSHGIILGSDSVPPSGAGGRSLEIWMQPGRSRGSNTFVAFYDPGKLRQLSLRQSDRDLELQIASSSAWRHQKEAKIYVDDAFRARKSAFWTVTSDSRGTSIYRDGVKVKESNEFLISSEEFSGRLIIGGSPIFNASWSGDLRGLAVYDSVLGPVQIARHHRTWTKDARPDITANDACLLLYLFDEHSGRIVHNSINRGKDLVIPAKYVVLNQTLLDPLWRAFNLSRGFWIDALINVSGFIPVGCFFCAYLSARGFGQPAFMASALGAATSLVIELVQSHLPTRDSSMSDLINNTLGSIVGATLYSGNFGRVIDRCVAWIIHLIAGRSRISRDVNAVGKPLR
jgi:VanZ family protein